MKKTISLILAMVIVLTGMFVGCSKKDDGKGKKDKTPSSENSDIVNSDTEFEIDTSEVTDKNGKTVTDKNGKPVTTEVAYKIVTDKRGNTHYEQLDDKGDVVKDKKGKPVTKLTTTQRSTNYKKTTTNTTTTMKQTATGTTDTKLTTLTPDKDVVPLTSATGTVVKFNAEDQNIIKNMLEVPYLYLNSYENKDGVPTEIAAHAAIWMTQNEGITTNSFASGTIVLGLFKYFGQTVVNFKTKCNSEKGNAKITYNSNDTFTINGPESKKQEVTLTKIEYIGNNNYYKVTAKVTNADGIDKVVAIVQKNRLDTTLGFSIKALKWS